MTEYVNSELDEKELPALTPEEIKVRLVNEVEQHLHRAEVILGLLHRGDLGVEAKRHNETAMEQLAIATESVVPLRRVLVREQNESTLGVVRHAI